jgi:hypothetical protein
VVVAVSMAAVVYGEAVVVKVEGPSKETCAAMFSKLVSISARLLKSPINPVPICKNFMINKCLRINQCDERKTYTVADV